MLDLEYQLKQLLARNRDNSLATQTCRSRTLRQSARQLHALGFRRLSVQSLKPKHAHALITHWLASGLSSGTVDNRISHLRWWAEKIGKRTLLPKTNAALGVPSRTYVTNRSKAHSMSTGQFARLTDPYTRAAVLLQQEFGLRREEAIKFRPAWADRGDVIHLKPSWCKGGRGRTVPVRTASQREALDNAHALSGHGSLIPPQELYVTQLKRFERQTARAGIGRTHGLRHAYAQRRYHDLTGWPAPAAGGPVNPAGWSHAERARLREANPDIRWLSREQRPLDQAARLIISAELGHAREQVTAVYLGR